MPEQRPTCIDLFCGCGGFTLGMLRAGFDVVAAIDFDPHAIRTLSQNLGVQTDCPHPSPGLILERDLTKFSPRELAELLQAETIDVVVGGPPCQGFSTARQVDGANHGERRLKDDPRRSLYKQFLEYIEYFQPKVFVFENVLGIRTAAGGEFLTRIKQEARELGRHKGLPGYRVHGQIEDAWSLGVPQKRRRQLLFGVRADQLGFLPSQLTPAPRAAEGTLLGHAIGDLPALSAGSGADSCAYDLQLRRERLQKDGRIVRKYLWDVLEVGRARTLANHVARPHSARDLRDFKRLREGESSAVAMQKRGIKFEFPYSKASFKDRYTRQSRHDTCSTIVAHLSKDGLMFIHPTQSRSFTPREAARVQSFPDWFVFPSARTHSFRMIGNAVPPLVAEAIGLHIRRHVLDGHQSINYRLNESKGTGHRRMIAMDQARDIRQKARKESEKQLFIPDSPWGATEALSSCIHLSLRELRLLGREDILRAWHAMIYLCPGLHPDDVEDAPERVPTLPEDQMTRTDISALLQICDARSGWPTAFIALAREVRRRYVRGTLCDDEYYCVSAQWAALNDTLIGNA